MRAAKRLTEVHDLPSQAEDIKQEPPDDWWNNTDDWLNNEATDWPSQAGVSNFCWYDPDLNEMIPIKAESDIWDIKKVVYPSMNDQKLKMKPVVLMETLDRTLEKENGTYNADEVLEQSFERDINQPVIEIDYADDHTGSIYDWSQAEMAPRFSGNATREWAETVNSDNTISSTGFQMQQVSSDLSDSDTLSDSDSESDMEDESDWDEVIIDDSERKETEQSPEQERMEQEHGISTEPEETQTKT